MLKQAVLQATGPILLPEFLPDLTFGPDPAAERGPAASTASATTDWDRFVEEGIRAGASNLYDEAVATAERQVIARVLRNQAGNQAHAAKILGITRTTLRSKMRQLGITLERVVGEEDDGKDLAEP